MTVLSGPAAIAALGAVLSLGAVLLLILALSGTRREPGPPGDVQRWLRRTVLGQGRSLVERRRHHALLASAAAGGAVAWLLTGLPVLGLLVLVAVPGLPWLLSVGRTEREAIVGVEAIGDWARRLKDLAATGVGLQQAIVASATGAPAALAGPVRDLTVDLQAGVAPRTALADFADELNDPAADRVVAALMLHMADRGDRLGGILGSLATASAAQAATRREVDAKRARARVTVRFLVGFTTVVLLYGVVRPEYMRPYTTPVGQVLMAALAAAFIAVLLWVRRMTQPARTARLLARAPGAGGAP
jgi:Flp pilus assembly protein TadB